MTEQTTNQHIHTLPHDAAAENSVISLLIQHGELFDECGLSADDFYIDAFREVFSRIQRLWEENKPIDFVTVNSACEGCELVGGIEGLKRIVSANGELLLKNNFKSYADIVRDKSARRRLIAISRGIIEIAYSVDKTLDQMRDEYERLITNESESTELTPVSEVLMNVFSELIAAKDKGRIPGQRTGWSDLDVFIGGLEKGTLTVVGARPAMGKSVFGANIAEYVAVDEKKAAVYFNLEMRENEVMQRMLSSRSAVRYSDLRFGMLDEHKYSLIGEAMDKLGSAPLYISDKPSVTLGEIKSISRGIKRRHGEIGIIVIDYLQLMGYKSGYNANRNDIIGELSRGLKTLAKELDCPIVALSQLSRAVEARADKRPMMSDLRESGSVEQDADTIIMLYRDEYYNKESADKGKAEVIVAKARQGQTGTVKMGFYPQRMRFDCLIMK